MQWATEELAGHPMLFWANHGLPMAEDFKKNLAAYINAASAQEIVPITTTSAALNAVAQSIAWHAGDNVLFCDIEFPSNAYPWFSLERDGVEARPVPSLGGGLTLAALEPLVDERTRLVAASAIQFFTGHRTDLAAIGAFCRQRGILFVVDAIQAIGHMVIDVQAMNIDVLATGGQKSLLAAPGVGFMYIRDAVAETLAPRMICSNATRDYLHWLAYDLCPLPGAQRFMAGTPNLVGMVSIVESLTLLQELSVEAIDQHTSYLTAVTADILADMGYQVITPRQPQTYGPIVTFKTGLDNSQTDALVAHLQQNHVTVVKHLDAAGEPYIRLSFHCYNTVGEIEQFAAILKEER
jgi:selenocysteine lyase/cysteine desulfurase